MPAAAVLRLAVDVHDVVGGCSERVATVLGDVVGVAGAFRENLPSVCGGDDGQLVLMLMARAEGADIDMHVHGLVVPSRTHDGPSRVGHPDGCERRRGAFRAVGGGVEEIRAVREEPLAVFERVRRLPPQGVVEGGAAAVRHAYVHVILVHAFQPLAIVLRHLDVVQGAYLIQAEEVAEADAVVAGGQFLLGAVRIDLQVQLFVNTADGVVAPFLRIFEFGEEDGDMEEAVHFHGEPIVLRRIGAQMVGVFIEGFDHQDDGVVVEDRGAEHAEEAVRPDAERADARRDGPPCGIGDVAVSRGGHEAVLHPAAHLVDEFAAVFFIAGLPVGVHERLPCSMAVQLPCPFVVFQRRRIDEPFDAGAELVGEFAAGQTVGDDFVRRMGIVLRIALFGRRAVFPHERHAGRLALFQIGCEGMARLCIVMLFDSGFDIFKPLHIKIQ